MRLQQFKLNKLAGNSLANREIKELKGGGSWGCSCSC
ncbi:TIGR04149 family rSAM-modified RiPP, partial [Bacteroides pyogenes]